MKNSLANLLEMNFKVNAKELNICIKIMIVLAEVPGTAQVYLQPAELFCF